MSQEIYVREKIEVIKKATEQQRSKFVWHTVNEISGRKQSNQGKLKAENQEEGVLIWKQHFQDLLGSEPPPVDEELIPVVNEDLPIDTSDFTMVELMQAIKRHQTTRLVVWTIYQQRFGRQVV